MVAKQTPTWFHDFAQRLRETICFPDPMTLVVLETKNGGIFMEDIDGSICGCFYWYKNVQGEIIVPLYECQTDTFLEDADSYKYALKFKPKLKVLLNEYKIQAVEYIFSSSKMVLSIMHNAKVAISDLFKSMIDDASLTSLINAPSSEKLLRLDYKESQEKTRPEVRSNFFISIYREIIRKVGKYPPRPEPTYEVIEDAIINNYANLQFNDITLASGSKEDIYKIIDVHKNTIKYYVEKNSQLANDICRCYERLLEIKENLFLEL